MSDSRSLKVLAGALLFVCATAMNASAQITSGQVSGTVTDPTGAVVPGATVVLTSESQGTKLAPVVTGPEGIYRFPNVTADTYTVEVTLTGFKTVIRKGMKVSGGDRVSVPVVALEPGGMTDEVTVKAEAPLIQAASGERSFTVQTQDVANLPTANGIRGFTSVMQLVPGVDGTTRLGGGGQTNYMMDGVSIMDTGNNGLMGGLNVPVDAIAEVKVLTSGYQAEYGRSSGLQVSAVTKSGTNRFHGSLYDVERNSDWNANSWENIQNGDAKTVSKQRDWGYTIGGPIGKPGGNNKLFFFYAHEFNPRTSNTGTTRYRMPTAEERVGNFSHTQDNLGALFNTIYDPQNTAGPGGTALPKANCVAADTRACFQDGGVLGQIPVNRLYGPGLALLNMWPLPNIEHAPGSQFNFLSETPAIKTLTYTPNMRVDYQASSRFRVSAKLSSQKSNADDRPGNLPGYTNTLMKFPWAINISTTVNYTITPTTFLEATFGGVQNQLGTPSTSFFSNRDNNVCPSGGIFAVVPNCTLGALPLLFPDAGVMDHGYYEYGALQKVGTPFLVGDRIMLPPSFSWGSRIIPTQNATVTTLPQFGFPGFMNINTVQDLSVSLTRVAGRHTFKGGFYVNHSFKAQNQGGGTSFQGALNFGNDNNNPNDGGFGYANAAVGSFSTYGQGAKFIEGGFVYNNVEGYIQDNWKINRRLTLDYGVRLVHQSPQYDTLKQTTAFLQNEWSLGNAPLLYTPGCPTTTFPCANTRVAVDPRTGLSIGAGTSALIGQAVLGTGKFDNGMRRAGDTIADTGYIWPALVLAPRFGVAFDLDGSQRFVFRGSVGLFYNRPDGNTVFGTVANPPNSTSTTQQWGSLTDLGSTKLASGPVPSINAFEYDSKIPADTQFNGGLQMVLPWSSSLDVEYVGHHEFNALAVTNYNLIDPGTTFDANGNAAAGADPTQNAGTAKTDNLLRQMRGYGSINIREAKFYRTYHSLQTSFNRRFRSGISFGGSWTWALHDFGNISIQGPQQRYDHLADGTPVLRADQADAEKLFGDQGATTHIYQMNFVWDLPDLQASSGVGRVIGQVINDWQLSGIFRGNSGSKYTPGFSYNSGGGQILTGSSDYSARVIIPDVGALGSGCSSDQYNQFNSGMVLGGNNASFPQQTTVLTGPGTGSVGLESGRFQLTGCRAKNLDLAIARNIRLGGGRTIQLRADMFNAPNTVVWDSRNSSVTFNSRTDQTVRNSQYSVDPATGTLRNDPNKLAPENAGFGAVSGSNGGRNIQAQVRFSF